jgi:hypothetical protein
MAGGDHDCDEDKEMQSEDSNSCVKQPLVTDTTTDTSITTTTAMVSNGEASPPSTSSSPPIASSPQLSSLTAMGIEASVAAKLDTLFNKGKLSIDDLDSRAIDALKQFKSEGAVEVLNQFDDSNLEHVSNKSAFLCGLMRTWRQKEKSAKMDGQRVWPQSASNAGNSGSNNSSNNNKSNNQKNATTSSSNSQQTHSGPDEAKIKAILERTGYK